MPAAYVLLLGCALVCRRVRTCACLHLHCVLCACLIYIVCVLLFQAGLSAGLARIRQDSSDSVGMDSTVTSSVRGLCALFLLFQKPGVLDIWAMHQLGTVAA